MNTNLFAVEPELVARLQAQLADLAPKVAVLVSADLAGVTEEQQITPAVHVVYQGYQVLETRSDGKTARMEQTWLVTTAVRNVKNMRSGAAARVDAGLIAMRVSQALMGFKPVSATRPLRLADAPHAVFNGGFQYTPLAFLAELALQPQA